MSEFTVDSISYLGWESNYLSIRPPTFFLILSTQFQWAQTYEKDYSWKIEHAVILANNTKSVSS